jgi:hypothetical protein
MGIDWVAAVFVGVPYEDIVKEVIASKEVTRYEELTGKPYKKIIEETYTVFLGEKIDDEALVEEKLNDMQLDLINIDPMGYGEYYIGEYISKLDEGEDGWLTLKNISETYESVKNKLTGLGYTEKPSIIHSLYAS